MARKELLVKFHKESITTAADRLFTEHGVEKTTMDDIAQEAQYSKATLYAYFKSKDDIFYSIVLKAMSLLHEQFQDILKNTENVRETYFSICTRLSTFCQENPLYFHSMLETIASDEESRAQIPILDEIYLVGETLNNDVEILIRRGIEQNVFDGDLPFISTGLLQWAAISGIVSIAHRKSDYVFQKMAIHKEQFMHMGFQMMFQAIAKD